MLTIAFNIILLFIAPFLMLGMIKKTKAFWGGRRGVSIFQPFLDFIKLLKKNCVYSETTSWIFKLAPVINLATVLFAAIFVPMINGVCIYNIPYSFVLFAYILGLGKFFMLLSSLDTGSSFEGMGASREACFSTIVEPAFFISMASIAILTGNDTLNSLRQIMDKTGSYGLLFVGLMVITLFIMLLIESCRVPVDDPATHLELTMIHEVMVLDNSGPDLALINWSSGIKMLLLSSLIINLVLPLSLPLWGAIGAFVLLLLIISILIGTLESAIARLRMTHIFEFVFIMTITALLILALVTYKIYGN